MGINYNYSKDESEESAKMKEETINIKAPKFYLNQEFPNYYNIPLEEVLKNLLKSKYDLLENKESNSSLSNQFKLLYKKQSDKNNEFSFSNMEFNEDKKQENITDNDNNNINKQNNINHNNNYISDNILDIKLDLLNKTKDNNQKEEEKIIEE